MFCDLVGSTPLSTRFDPEELREIVGAYHRCVTETVEAANRRREAAVVGADDLAQILGIEALRQRR